MNFKVIDLIVATVTQLRPCPLLPNWLPWVLQSTSIPGSSSVYDWRLSWALLPTLSSDKGWVESGAAGFTTRWRFGFTAEWSTEICLAKSAQKHMCGYSKGNQQCMHLTWNDLYKEGLLLFHLSLWLLLSVIPLLAETVISSRRVKFGECFFQVLTCVEYSITMRCTSFFLSFGVLWPLDKLFSSTVNIDDDLELTCARCCPPSLWSLIGGSSSS